MTARTYRSGWASESASSEVLDGAGITGDAIGVAVTQPLAVAGTTPGATLSITGTPSTVAEVSTEVEPCGEELLTAAEVRVSTEVEACAAVVSARGPALSTETRGRLADSLNPAVRVASAQAPSAASGMADRQGVFRFVEDRVSGVEDFMVAEDFMVVVDFSVAAVGNRSFVRFPVNREL